MQSILAATGSQPDLWVQEGCTQAMGKRFFLASSRTNPRLFETESPSVGTLTEVKGVTRFGRAALSTFRIWSF